MAARKTSARSRAKATASRSRRPAKQTVAKSARRPAAKARAPRRSSPAKTPAAMAMNAPNGKPPINGIGLTHHHLDFTSHDVEGIRHFYADLLGFKNFLYIPEHKYLTIMISPTSSAGFMAPMPGPPESWRPPGEPSFYFYVEDVDQACAALEARGVTIDQPPTDMPWGHRIATFRDPEGRQICVARNIT